MDDRTRSSELVDRIEQLHWAARRLQGCSTEEDAFGAVIDATVEILGYDWCVLAAADAEMFELVAVSPDAPVTVGDRHLRINEGVAGESFQSGNSILERDVYEAERGEPVNDSFRGVMTVPINDWGVFQTVSSEVGFFSEADLELAELLLAHFTEAIRRLDDKRQLHRQNERLEEFASVVSHDLRSPLNVATGWFELYRETGADEHAEAVEVALSRMDRLLDDVLTLAREGEHIGDTERVQLEPVARDAWAAIDSTGAQLDAVDATLIADASRLQQLLENLFRNSVEHGSTNLRPNAHENTAQHGSAIPRVGPNADDGADDPPVTVRVGPLEPADPREESTRTQPLSSGFFVEDDGPGIPSEEREDVFEVGYTTSESGTGLGLNIVETIATAHGWESTLTESARGGVRIEFV